MSKYSINLVEHNDYYFYCIHENLSDQILEYFVFHDDAEEQLKKIQGKGFDGFTPAFILNNVQVYKKGINSQFKSFLSK